MKTIEFHPRTILAVDQASDVHGRQSQGARNKATEMKTRRCSRFYYALKIAALGVLGAMAAGNTRAATSVAVWGSNGSGQTNVPPDLTNAVAIAPGSCA